MPRIRVATVVDGEYRGPFSILEKSSGELIIPIPTDARHGRDIFDDADYETAPKVSEQRISVHESLNSSKYTTIKRTVVLSNGERITAVALMDSVKAKNGFSSIFVRRIETMIGEGYAQLGKVKIGDRLMCVPEYDPRIFTIFSGLYIGHPDVPFDVRDKEPGLLIEPIKFRKFQLITMFYLMEFRSHYTGEIGINVTSDPTSMPTKKGKALFATLMQGKPASACVQMFYNVVWDMARRVIDLELRQATTPEAISYFKARLAQIPERQSVLLGGDTTAPPIRILFGD